MLTSATVSEVSKAITLAQAEFKGVGKSGNNTFDKYAYANLEDYVKAIKPVLIKHNLSVLTSVEEVVALEDRKTQKGGTEHAVRVKIIVRIVHTSGEWVEASAWGEGQDRADKAVYKAITGARKYGLASALGLATTDDPEADNSVGNSEGNGVSEAELNEMFEQMERVNLSNDIGRKWLDAAKVKTFNEMTKDQVAKCIDKMKKMPTAAQTV